MILTISSPFKESSFSHLLTGIEHRTTSNIAHVVRGWGSDRLFALARTLPHTNTQSPAVMQRTLPYKHTPTQTCFTLTSILCNGKCWMWLLFVYLVFCWSFSFRISADEYQTRVRFCIRRKSVRRKPSEKHRFLYYLYIVHVFIRW